MPFSVTSPSEPGATVVHTHPKRRGWPRRPSGKEDSTNVKWCFQILWLKLSQLPRLDPIRSSSHLKPFSKCVYLPKPHVEGGFVLSWTMEVSAGGCLHTKHAVDAFSGESGPSRVCGLPDNTSGSALLGQHNEVVSKGRKGSGAHLRTGVVHHALAC